MPELEKVNSRESWSIQGFPPSHLCPPGVGGRLIEHLDIEGAHLVFGCHLSMLASSAMRLFLGVANCQHLFPLASMEATEFPSGPWYMDSADICSWALLPNSQHLLIRQEVLLYLFQINMDVRLAIPSCRTLRTDLLCWNFFSPIRKGEITSDLHYFPGYPRKDKTDPVSHRAPISIYPGKGQPWAAPQRYIAVFALFSFIASPWVFSHQSKQEKYWVNVGTE